MEQRHVEGDATPAPSRRRHRPTRRRRLPALSHLAPRAGVLVALGLATVAAPVVHALTPVEIMAEPVAQGPSAYQVFADTTVSDVPTSVLAALPVIARPVETVSRALERDPLPGCDGEARTDLVNGRVSSSDLCLLWDGKHALRGDAAVALTELNENFEAAFGRGICMTDSYRSYADQVRAAATKPGLATTPGTSNHGYGLAIDLCSSETRTADVMTWLWDNGPVYGWVNPDWAQRGGSGAYEPWHWEFLPGTDELGTAW